MARASKGALLNIHYYYYYYYNNNNNNNNNNNSGIFVDTLVDVMY